MGALEGYTCAAIAVLLFGSNFTVVAKYDPGDGMFFQLVLCIGIWCTGLVVFLLRGAPTFYPLAVAGGIIWCTGNCATVSIINRIGLGPGLVTWGTSALMIGWLTGFFGLPGIPSDQGCLQMPWLNVVGFALSICALVDSTLMRKGAVDAQRNPQLIQLASEPAGLGQGPQELPNSSSSWSTGGPTDILATEGSASSRSTGMLMAVAAGFCYGVNFLPSTWIMHNVAGASQDGLDYVFNQFCGILLASVFYFLLYCAYKGNKPAMNPEIVLPGFVSGVMWAIAQACWFVANAQLGYSTAFPIILIGPGFVGSLWSVFLFKDIYGKRNYFYLAAYFCIAAAASGCIVFSRKTNCA